MWSPRRAALAIAALAGALALADPKATKNQISSDGVYAVRFEVDGERCRLVVTRGTEDAWTLEKCVGSADDLYFISNDGERVWIIHTLPEKPPKPARGKKGTPWFSVPVGELIEKDGSFVRAVKLTDVTDQRARDKVQQLEKRFKWLEGVLGVPGKGPRINEHDQVEFEVTGGKTQKLGFAGPAQ